MQKEIHRAIGKNFDAFVNKFGHLQQKWTDIAKKNEYGETRFLSPYLFNRSNIRPIYISIISDNLKYFKNHYEHSIAESTSNPIEYDDVFSGLMHKLPKSIIDYEIMPFINFDGKLCKCLANKVASTSGVKLFKTPDCMWMTYLKLACLCGSEQIGEFLIQQISGALPPWLLARPVERSEILDQSTILSWIAIGDNLKWAEKIAKIMVEKGLPIPDHIYCLTSCTMIEMLWKVFGVSLTNSIW